MRSGSRRGLLPNLKGRGIEAAADPRDALPPGWVRVESRSKPGSYYYAHPSTKRTQVERPVDPRYAHRAPASAPSAPAAPTKPAAPAIAVEDPETKAERRKKEEARKAEQKAREEAEDAEREEVLRRARERRAQERLEEEKRRKEEEEQEEEERQKVAERRAAKKREAARLEAERKEAERQKAEQEQRERAESGQAEAAGSEKPEGSKAVSSEAKWKQEAGDEDEDDEVTLEDLEKWKESEELREKEEEDEKKRQVEEEERKKIEVELEKVRKKAEFDEAVERARQMKNEADRQKKEELRRGPEAARPVQEDLCTTPKAPPPVAPAAVASEPPAPAVASPPPPPPPPPPPTLSHLLSGAAPQADFGALLSTPVPEPDLKRQRVGVEAEPAMLDVGPQAGTVVWYNGRRRHGMLLADRDRRMLGIPAQAAQTGGLAPPVPAGLMHGTRVSYRLDFSGGPEPCCSEVRPLDGQVGLSCGGDTQSGHRLGNEDRTIATDLQEGLGHMVGIFDGHRGTFCADFLAQELPKSLVNGAREAFSSRLLPGMTMDSLSETEEVEAIRMGLAAGFEAADRNFLSMAQQYGFKDGASALVALVVHGFRAGQASLGTVPRAPGGQAKLFAVWSGTGHILLLRGRQALRCSEDHVCNRQDERTRLAAAGAHLVQDLRGVWWMGRPGNPELAWARQQCYEEVVGPKSFLAASRGFGDILMKGPPYPVLTASPDVQVVDLCPDDWAIVLCGRGIFTVLSDQDVANACWEMMTMNGQGPQQAAQAVTQRALQLGAKSNLTCIVMRLGWAQPPQAG